MHSKIATPDGGTAAHGLKALFIKGLFVIIEYTEGFFFVYVR